MALNITNAFLILILALFFTFSSSIAETPQTVHLISKLDNGTNPVQIKCKINGAISADLTLKSGQDFQFTTNVKGKYNCEASWGRYIAAFDAFEPTRDKGHSIIYWWIKEDGFYLSWNKIDWKLIVEWESE